MEIAGSPVDDKARAIVAGDLSGIREDGTSMAQFGFEFPNVSWPNRHPVLFWLIMASLGYGAYRKYNEGQGGTSGSDNTVFDAPRFTPFTITKREEISPTSII